jgi:hypothetical protein
MFTVLITEGAGIRRAEIATDAKIPRGYSVRWVLRCSVVYRAMGVLLRVVLF